MFKVAKFGGSSLSSSRMFKKVKAIVLADKSRKIVVVSALGKRDKDDSKITDLLYILHAHLKFGVPYLDVWEKIKERFLSIRNELSIDYPIEEELEIIERNLSKDVLEEYLISRGEYLTAKLMASFLGFTFVDSMNHLIFDYNGKVNDNLTEINFKKEQQKYDTIVVPGFYGSYHDSTIHLFTRGGSDITGSILARSLNVEMYENWTDVSGILKADPRIILNPMTINEITYNELRELSYMGANVLHEETIFPVQELNIPINIRNTNHPLHPGTIIRNICKNNGSLITGIAGKKDFLSINITKPHLSNEIGYIRKILTIFENYQVSIEHIPTGIDSISVVVSSASVSQKLYDIIKDIKVELDAYVEVTQDISLIAIVGRNMHHQVGLSGTIFGILGKNKINVLLIAQGPLELNIIVGVSNTDYEKTVQVLYDEVVTKQ